MTVGTGSSSDTAARERYATRLRRDRIWYSVAIAVVVVAASVIATVVWLNGEIAHTTLRTVAKPPAAVPLATSPSATQHKLWSTTDHPALGTPYFGGTAVTYDTHTVRGRDARTGTQTWSYTRTDRSVCTAMQVGGYTVAVYRLNGNCDELTALDSDTGKRHWTRTLDFDSHPLNGQPAFETSASQVMFVSPAAIYAIDVPSGDQGWLFAETGCTVQHVVLGTAGALISQTCAHRDCSEVKHCLNGPQLVLRDPAAGQNTDSSKNNGNPDQITWAIKNPAGLVPASAGAVIAAYAADGSSLAVLASKDGKTTATLPLRPVTATLATSSDSSLSDGEILYAGGMAYSITGPPGSINWSVAAATGPTVTSGAISVVPVLSQATLSMAGAGGIVQLNPNTGKTMKTYPVSPAPSATARVYPYGTGFLVAGNDVAVYG